MSTSKIAIAVVTFNNLELTKKCFSSWRRVPNAKLFLWDNGSDREMVEWLSGQPIDRLWCSEVNQGVTVGRNRIIEHARDEGFEHVLILDSDLLLHDGAVDHMVRKMARHPDAGMVAFEQANKAFPIGAEGQVEEVANECLLTRMEMWRMIGGYPETQLYYSSDSWKATIANMHGWHTYVVRGVRGYDHWPHSSRRNAGVDQIQEEDTRRWGETETRFKRYWRARERLGKGEQYRMQKWSQAEEEDLILEWFAGREGRLLDLGAYDGVKMSNSRALIMAGWEALLVEPNWRAFGGLFETYSGHKKVVLLNAAVAPENGIVNMWDNEAGLSTISGRVSAVDKLQKQFGPAYQISTVTPAQIAARYGTEWHFVSIDCEGMDLEIFKASKSLLKHTEMICFEHTVSGTEFDDGYYEKFFETAREFGFENVAGITNGNTLLTRAAKPKKTLCNEPAS